MKKLSFYMTAVSLLLISACDNNEAALNKLQDQSKIALADAGANKSADHSKKEGRLIVSDVDITLDKETEDWLLSNTKVFGQSVQASSEYGKKAWGLFRTLSIEDKPVLREKIAQILSNASLSHEAGDSSGTFLLGLVYWIGLGVDRDAAEGLMLLKQASEQGQPEASYLLGELYEQGQGNDVKQDKVTAYEYYKKAALQGDLNANLKMYNAIRSGNIQGFAKDNIQAKYYLSQAAKGDFPRAWYEEGMAILYGDYGYEQNTEKGVALIEKAYKGGDMKAKQTMAKIYYMFDGYEDIEKAQALAQEVIDENPQATDLDGAYYILIQSNIAKAPKVAWDYGQQGWQQSQQRSAIIAGQIGIMYNKGVYVEQDYEKAKEWFEKSWELNDPDLISVEEGLALSFLADMYFSVWPNHQDYTQARLWYERAAQEGISISYNRLGVIYALGHGVDKDLKKAEEYYKKSIELDDYVIAKSNLASLYYHYDTQDYRRLAFELYEEVANQGYPLGMRDLSVLYFKGQGVVIDYERCYVWAKLAYLRDGNEAGNTNIELCEAELVLETKQKLDKEIEQLNLQIPILDLSQIKVKI